MMARWCLGLKRPIAEYMQLTRLERDVWVQEFNRLQRKG